MENKKNKFVLRLFFLKFYQSRNDLISRYIIDRSVCIIDTKISYLKIIYSTTSCVAIQLLCKYTL